MATPPSDSKPVRLIKRYSNRKLYDTLESSYITLDQIAAFVRQGEEIRIIDNRTKEDLTDVTLAQIIFEQQKNRQRRTPLVALRQLVQGSTEFLQRLGQPVTQLRDEANQTVERIKLSSELLDSGRQRLIDLVEGLEESLDDVQRRFDDNVRAIVEVVMSVPDTDKELEALRARIDALEQQVGMLTSVVRDLAPHHDVLNTPPPVTTTSPVDVPPANPTSNGSQEVP